MWGCVKKMSLLSNYPRELWTWLASLLPKQTFPWRLSLLPRLRLGSKHWILPSNEATFTSMVWDLRGVLTAGPNAFRTSASLQHPSCSRPCWPSFLFRSTLHFKRGLSLWCSLLKGPGTRLHSELRWPGPTPAFSACRLCFMAVTYITQSPHL